jgi:hypothetical protein
VKFCPEKQSVHDSWENILLTSFSTYSSSSKTRNWVLKHDTQDHPWQKFTRPNEVQHTLVLGTRLAMTTTTQQIFQKRRLEDCIYEVSHSRLCHTTKEELMADTFLGSFSFHIKSNKYSALCSITQLVLTQYSPQKSFSKIDILCRCATFVLWSTTEGDKHCSRRTLKAFISVTRGSLSFKGNSETLGRY